MFVGEYTHSIDSKNRLSLPSKFRQEMGKKVILTPGLDGCLFVFTLKKWQGIAESLSKSSMLQADSRGFNRYMFGGATEADIDRIGRVLVPEFLIKGAKLSEKVAVIGVQDRVEIWDEKKWKQYKSSTEKRADTLAERLGQIGVL